MPGIIGGLVQSDHFSAHHHTSKKGRCLTAGQQSFNFTLFVLGMYVFSGGCICKTLVLELNTFLKFKLSKVNV